MARLSQGEHARLLRDEDRKEPIEEITEEVEAVREGMHRASGRLIPTSG